MSGICIRRGVRSFCVVRDQIFHRCPEGPFQPERGISRRDTDAAENIASGQARCNPSLDGALAFAPERAKLGLRQERGHEVDAPAPFRQRPLLDGPYIRPAQTPFTAHSYSAQVALLDPLTDGAGRQAEMLGDLGNGKNVRVALLHREQIVPGAEASKFLRSFQASGCRPSSRRQPGPKLGPGLTDEQRRSHRNARSLLAYVVPVTSNVRLPDFLPVALRGGLDAKGRVVLSRLGGAMPEEHTDDTRSFRGVMKA